MTIVRMLSAGTLVTLLFFVALRFFTAAPLNWW